MFVFYSQILFLLLFPVLKPLKDHNLALVTPFHLLFCQPSLLFTAYLPTYLLSPQTNLIPTPLTRKTKNICSATFRSILTVQNTPAWAGF